jgi:hypothetical protein
VQQAREAARRTQCRNNLKQIGLALANYENAFKMYPQAAQNGASAATLGYAGGWAGHYPNTLSWRVMILPYIEQQNLYNQFNFLGHRYYNTYGPGKDPISLSATPVSSYLCPSDPTDTGDNKNLDFDGNSNGAYGTNYAAMYKIGAFPTEGNTSPAYTGSNDYYNAYLGTLQVTGNVQNLKGYGGLPLQNLRVRDYTDGMSTTVQVVEKFRGKALIARNCHWPTDPVACPSGTPGSPRDLTGKLCAVWAAEGGYCVGDATATPNSKGPDQVEQIVYAQPVQGTTGPASSAHTGGAFALFGDASVRMISNSVNLTTWQNTCSFGRGEVATVNE